MTLGIFLALGDSFEDMKKSGQDVRFKRFYLSKFSKNFEKVYIFSYANEKVTDLHKNVILVPNKWKLHRYLYSFLLPFLNFSTILKSDVFRAYHLSGTPSAIIARIFFLKPFVFNYAYDYQQFSEIENKKLQKYFFSFLGPFAIFFAKKVFAANKAIFRKIGEKAIYLSNGVDTNFFKPSKNKTKNAKPVILSVGRLEEQKNFESLIMAMQGLDARLIIVGQGSLLSKLNELAKDNKVHLKIIPKVENTKMPQVYLSADIFVSPSLIEGSPKVIFEAMSCGLPVITVKNEGTLDISANALVFSEEESISLRKNIQKLIHSNDLRDKFGHLARKEIQKKYDLNKLILKEISVLKVHS